MSRLVAAAVLFLLTASTASAQVLDDDLEFENHVAVIELDEDSPVLAGIGLSREITYEAHFEGTLYLSVMADAGVDPFLRVEDQEGKVIAQDDDLGGGKHAFVKLDVKGGETFVIRMAVKGITPALVRFKLFEAEEAEATRGAAKDGGSALGDVARLRQAGELEEARERLKAAVAALLAVPGAEGSDAIERVLADAGFEAQNRLGAVGVAEDSWGSVRA